MTDVYTTGWWKPKDGQEKAFVEAWTEFARWASSHEGAGTLRLARDLKHEGHYASFGRWGSLEQVRGWKASTEFGARMARVQQHVAEFHASELEVVAAVAGAEVTPG